MKVVRIIARLNVGGPARHVVWLNEALQNDKFQSVLLTGRVPDGEEDMSYFAEQHKIKHVFIEEMSRELSVKDIVSLWKIYRHILREKPDIIHTHTAKAGTVGRTAGFFYRWMTPKTLLGKPRKVKIIHTFHGHIFHGYYSNLKTKVFLFIEKTLAKFATDKIIVISKQQKSEIHNDFNVGKSGQFEVIPLGIDLKAFKNWREKRNNLREEIGAKDDELLIGLVGRLTEIKNHVMFLRVIQRFNETVEADFPNIRFIIIGDGNLRDKLENLAKELKVSDSIVFLGNRNDADIFYAGLDIIALTSVNEGTPLSLIEAMANEKPVISTLVGGVVDLLGEVEVENDGYTICERGIGIASNDAEGFCKGLHYLVKNEKLRCKLSENGKKFVLEKYDKKRLINDIKSLYENLSKTC
ncbi:MAG: glycosyltransferase [Aridibacter sp.]